VELAEQLCENGSSGRLYLERIHPIGPGAAHIQKGNRQPVLLGALDEAKGGKNGERSPDAEQAVAGLESGVAQTDGVSGNVVPEEDNVGFEEALAAVGARRDVEVLVCVWGDEGVSVWAELGGGEGQEVQMRRSFLPCSSATRWVFAFRCSPSTFWVMMVSWRCPEENAQSSLSEG